MWAMARGMLWVVKMSSARWRSFSAARELGESLGDVLGDRGDKTGPGMPFGGVGDLGNGQTRGFDFLQSLVDSGDIFIEGSRAAMGRHDDGENFGFALLG